jgi:hypothetical protein
MSTLAEQDSNRGLCRALSSQFLFWGQVLASSLLLLGPPPPLGKTKREIRGSSGSLRLPLALGEFLHLDSPAFCFGVPRGS